VLRAHLLDPLLELKELGPRLLAPLAFGRARFSAAFLRSVSGGNWTDLRTQG
jgi:hypothetical protein